MFIKVFSYGFFYTFCTCKWKKNEKLKKVLAKKPKDKWSSHVTGKRFLNTGTEEQQNYYEQRGKESISKLRIKITWDLREMTNSTKFKGSVNMLTETFIITSIETYVSETEKCK